MCLFIINTIDFYWFSVLISIIALRFCFAFPPTGQMSKRGSWQTRKSNASQTQVLHKCCFVLRYVRQYTYLQIKTSPPSCVLHLYWISMTGWANDKSELSGNVSAAIMQRDVAFCCIYRAGGGGVDISNDFDERRGKKTNCRPLYYWKFFGRRL